MTLTVWLYTLLCVGLTINIYRPVLRHPRAMVYSFFAGWFAGELALQLTLIQMLLTVVLIFSHSFAGIMGMVALVALLANWLALLRYYYQGRALGPQLDSNLKKGLGNNYRQEINSDLASGLQLEPDFMTELNPFRRNRGGVTIASDVAYGHEGLTLDIYRPSIALHRPAPVLMHVHGGAWMYGDKVGQALPLMLHLARLGWVCCSVAYRLSPRATHPDHITDCKAALTWIKANIADHGGDANFIAVTGGSAGGHLTALLALTANDPAFQQGFEDADTSVQAAVPFYGVFDWTDRDQLQHNSGLRQILERTIVKDTTLAQPDIFSHASPLLRIHEHAPPFMIVHGDRDSLVPIGLGRKFAKALTEVSEAPVVYSEIPGAQHAFDIFASPRSEHVKLAVARFLTTCYSRYLNQISG